MQACAAGYTLTYFTTPKRQLATWTDVDLTAAKFKLHILLMHDFPLPNFTYI
jgi:hypothetical protein